MKWLSGLSHLIFCIDQVLHAWKLSPVFYINLCFPCTHITKSRASLLFLRSLILYSTFSLGLLRANTVLSLLYSLQSSLGPKRWIRERIKVSVGDGGSRKVWGELRASLTLDLSPRSNSGVCESVVHNLWSRRCYLHLFLFSCFLSPILIVDCFLQILDLTVDLSVASAVEEWWVVAYQPLVGLHTPLRMYFLWW
jgi:hypothetical protein